MTRPVHHVLDRPIWHALKGRQAQFSTGGGRALRYVPEIAPFAATADDDAESLAALAELIPPGGTVMLLQVGEIPLPPGVVAQVSAIGVQMIAEKLVPLDPPPTVARLGEADAEEMFALTTLTKPGPYQPRTHRLGQFWGLRENGKLVAMAGERMKLPGFTEVSGVCTHPDLRGRGYAGLLSRVVATQILNRGETPFLHAYATNTPAIRLYESLGFVLRTHVNGAVLVRAAN